MPCSVFHPEDFRQPTDRDDLASFHAMIAAMSPGDRAELSCRDYLLGDTLHLNKAIVIAGSHENPHSLLQRSRLVTTAADTLGIRLLVGCTLRDLELVSIAPRGADLTKHGIWCRRSPALINVRVENYAGDGVFLDSTSLVATTAAASAAADGTVTLVFAAPHPFTRDMVISTTGLAHDTPSAGVVVLEVAPTQVKYVQPGVPAGPFARGVGTVTTIQNCDHWEAHDLRCGNNGGSGFHTRGPRSNAGTGINIDCVNNELIGVFEDSFLGNTYVGCHAAGNQQGYAKPASADNNKSIFVGCYAESAALASEVSYPATRFAGAGSWVGSGLAGAFDASFGRPTQIFNFDANNDYSVHIVAVTVAGPVGAEQATATVDPGGPAHHVRVGMRVLTSSLGRDTPSPMLVRAVTAGTITYDLPGAPIGPMADGDGTLTVRNQLVLDLGGATSTLYGYTAESNGPRGDARHYRKQFYPFLPSFSNWFITRSNHDSSAVVEAESGELAVDSTGATLGAGQKWFPNGFYYGGAADMWKQDTERRGTLRVTTLRDSASPGNVRGVAWASAAPTAGAWNPGDLVWNAAPSATRPIGWVCTSASPLGFLEMPRLNAVVDPAAAVRRALVETINVPFTAGPGAADDVIIYNASCPGALRILDVSVMVSLAAPAPAPATPPPTLQLRDGAGTPCSDAFDSTTTGRKRDTGFAVQVTRVIPDRGTLVLHRTNSAVAGEIIVIAAR